MRRMHGASKISLACANVLYLIESRRFLEGDMGTIVLVTIGITVYTQVKKKACSTHRRRMKDEGVESQYSGLYSLLRLAQDLSDIEVDDASNK